MQESLLIRMLMPMVSRYYLVESLTILFISNSMVFLNFSWFSDDLDPAHLSLQFRVFLRNASTKRYTQEKRVISYWFKLAFSPMQQASAAQDFFKQLVSPADFPRGMIISESRQLNRLTVIEFIGIDDAHWFLITFSYFQDYVGFIKKIMKLMQNEYPMIAKIEIEMTQEMEMDCLPIRASKSGFKFL